MIIVGWGKEGKPVAYLGIAKCPNCKNWTHLTMHELSSQVRLYFVPVAKFNKKHYVVCGVCDAAWELDAAKVPALLADSARLPSKEIAAAIWSRCDELLTKHLADLAEFPEEGLQLLRQQLHSEFNPAWADIVFSQKMASLADDDPPR